MLVAITYAANLGLVLVNGSVVVHFNGEVVHLVAYVVIGYQVVTHRGRGQQADALGNVH